MTTMTTAARPSVSIPAWSIRQILGLWAAAALPMAALAWVVAPLVAHLFSGPAALPRALILCLTAGLVWQFALVMIVVRREQGSLRWPVIKAALWLQAPRSPSTGRAKGMLWIVLIPCMLIFGAEELLPAIPAVTGHDLPTFMASAAGTHILSGSWAWFGVITALAVFNTVLGEELLFRGLLLPRMGRFGRADWVVNGVLFAMYHLHEPWVIPQTVLVDTFAEALPSRRYRSSLIGIAVHSSQTVFFIAIGLSLVLK